MALHKTCILARSVKAAAAAKANRFLTYAGAIPAAGANSYGVTVSDAAAGEMVAVDALGTTIVESTAAAIGIGDAVATAAPGAANVDGGKAVKHAGNAKIVGRALTAVPAAGGLLEIMLIPN